MTKRQKANKAPTAATISATLDTLGPRILSIRTLRGMSQHDVVKLTDNAISPAGVSRLETGDRRDPLASTLLAFSMALDVDIKLTRTGTIEILGTGLAGSGAQRKETTP